GTPLGATQLNTTANVPGTFAYTPAAGTVLGAGNQTLSVTFTPTDTANYAVTSKNVSITVNKAPLAVTVQAANKTYGAANPGFTVGYGAFVNGDGPGSLGGTLAFATSATSNSVPGSYNVTASGLTSANYTISYVAGTLTVNQAPLTITAQDKSRAFGAANPSFTASYSGFVLGQTASVLAGTLSCSTTANASSPAGPYPITCAGQTSNNYAISYVAGTLTVGQASQTITFAALANKNYGDPAFTLSATASSWLAVAFSVPVGGPCTVSGTTLTIVGVGTCTVTAAQAGDANYSAATNAVRSFTIAKGTPTLTWNTPAAITYGTALSATQLNASTGVAGSFAYTPASGAILAVGTQTLSVTFTPTDTVNYNSASTTVSLTVNKAALSVTTQAASKTYGAANPAFSATYGGFVNGDGPGSLGGTLVFATSATTSSTPGGYNVTPSGLTSANYAISYVAGSLTVNQAPLTIAAQDKSRTFGAANPTFTVSYSGFVLGQSSASLGGTLSCATTAVAASLPGGYPITCSGQTSTNYAISYVAGTLTITAAPTTVTVPTVSVTLGVSEATLVANLASTAAVNGGTVTFTVTQGPTTIGTVISGTAANGAASAAFDLTGLNAGSYVIAASYSGAGASPPGAATAPHDRPGERTITFDPLANKAYGDAAFTRAPQPARGWRSPSRCRSAGRVLSVAPR
ncbi:MAG: MBG domain-containing protein, partial [Thermomicrobiales bacterium]